MNRRRFPRCTREEEHALLVHYHQSRDPAARERLVTANYAYVRSVAQRLSRVCESVAVEDLEQEGVMGLLKAVENYDPKRHQVALIAFAQQGVRSRILAFIRASRLVQPGRGAQQRRLYYRAGAAAQRLRAEGKDVTAESLAQRCDVTVKAAALHLSGGLPPAEEDRTGGAESAEQRLLLATVKRAATTLRDNPRLTHLERLVLDNLISPRPEAPRDLSQRAGRTVQRIRQVEADIRQALARRLAG